MPTRSPGGRTAGSTGRREAPSRPISAGSSSSRGSGATIRARNSSSSFAEGGGNTWGIDFDRFGNLFAGGNTYEPLCHHVQGAYYVKGFGKHGPLHNPYSFGYFQPVKHYGPFGGGLTGGCSIYQGARFPERFNNACIAPNMRQNALALVHVREARLDLRHAARAAISSFRAIAGSARSTRLVGPDGALYIADWYDINLSHSNPKNRSQWYAPSRDDGRICRVSAKGSKIVRQAADPFGATRLARSGGPFEPSERMVSPRGVADPGRTARSVGRAGAQAEARRRLGRDGRARGAVGDPSLRRIR